MARNRQLGEGESTNPKQSWGAAKRQQNTEISRRDLENVGESPRGLCGGTKNV